MEQTFNWKRLLITIGIVILTAGVVGGTTWYLMGEQAKKDRVDLESEIDLLKVEIDKSNEMLKEATEKNEDKISGSTEIENGLIEGSISYPSRGIPDDIVINAEDINSGKVYTTTQQQKDSKYKYGVGFKLEVPAGTYFVYATSSTFNDNNGVAWKAYYNKFVTCGMNVSCKDFSKIPVKVESGKLSALIEVGDWYPEK